MAKTKSKKSKKEYVFLIVFVIIMIVIGFVIIRYLVLEDVETSGAEPVIKPAYLNQSIPEVKQIENVINNPKFKEMVYMESFFKPIKVKEQGRPNPFAPFGKAKQFEEEPSSGEEESTTQEEESEENMENLEETTE